MKGAAAIAATAALITAGTAAAVIYTAWSWARGYDDITRSDHFERRNS